MKSLIIIIITVILSSCLLALSWARKESEREDWEWKDWEWKNWEWMDPEWKDWEWKAFKTKYNKQYEDLLDEAFRREIFLENKYHIDLHNRKFQDGKVTFAMGINQFADMTNKEFNRRMKGYERAPCIDPSVPLHRSIKVSEESKDWRDEHCVSPVRNQEDCGACWAFAATAATESVTCIHTTLKYLPVLSVQNLIDCSVGEGNKGCNGGYAEGAYTYIAQNDGIDTDASYPYQVAQRVCTYVASNRAATLDGYVRVEEYNEEALKSAVNQQPVSVSIDASKPTFQFYNGTGVYYEADCSSEVLDHAVLIVGYGVDTQRQMAYWIVKNSYGSTWGREGYIYMARNFANNCGIATDATYPIYKALTGRENDLL